MGPALPPGSPESAGRAAVELVRASLTPDVGRVREANDSFRWWPHAFEQHVFTRAPRADGACVVAVETVLLSGVRGRAPELATLAARNARDPGLSALRWDSETERVSLRAAVIARPGDGGAAARRLAHAALLQVGDALLAADALAVEFPEATLAEAAERGSAKASVVEQAEAWRAYAAGGAAAAASLEAAVARLASLAPAPWQRVTRAPHGIDAEISCSSAATGSAPGAGLALLRVSAGQPHPRLGPGLVLVLVPPAGTEPDAERAPATAALLNEAESREWTGVDQLGGWCVHPAAGLSHVLYLPALAAEDDSTETLVWHAAMRARWAVAFLSRLGPLRVPRSGAAEDLGASSPD